MRKKHQYEVKPGEWVEIIPKKQVRLFGIRERRVWDPETEKFNLILLPYERTFVLGDVVEYDSYNLSYTGHIVGITAKTITVNPGSRNNLKRMKVGPFHMRNWNFDAEETVKKNFETMRHI